MPTDFWFRLSTHLALALSCVCLGYAEWDLLQEVSGFAGVVIVLLVATFLLEKRFELGLGKANLLGLAIGVLAVVWLVYNVSRPRAVLREMDWPTGLLPLIAPVLMALIPAKLFRPKHVGDWWAMHGVALAGVGLAAAMEDDAVFVLLLAAYAITAVWSLVLFFYRRNGGFVAPLPDTPARPVVQVLTADPFGRSPRWLFVRSVLWVSLAAAFALPVFFVLPRPTGAAWSYTKPKYEVGQSTEPTVDISKSGELTKTEEVAYHLTVTAAAADQPADIPTDQLWRARSFTDYNNGTWSRGNTPIAVPYEPFDQIRMTPADDRRTDPAEFGPTGFEVEFTPFEKERFTILASPIRWIPRKVPVRWFDTGALWQRTPDGAYHGLSRTGRLGRYVQACGPPAAPGLGQPFELRDEPEVLSILRRTVPYATEYATELLDELVRDGKLPAAAVRKNDPLNRVAPEFHEAVARLFSTHIADSGRFTYTTVLRRQDSKVDPIEDFLRNTRSGNCELFATALIHLLRGVNIPAQYVTGYKGWEPDEEGNRLLIRRNQAHAWVEVLVTRPPNGFAFHPNTPPDRRQRVWHWLSLDPTPGDYSVAQAETRGWFERWFGFLIGYDREKQKATLEALGRFGARYGPILAALVFTTVLGRWWWRRRRTRAQAAAAEFDGPPWYAGLLAALAGRGFTPNTGETPREFAERVAGALRARGSPAADVPPFVASKLYRVRYAAATLTADEEGAIASAVAKLESTEANR
jgi:hypothetical protein